MTRRLRLVAVHLALVAMVLHGLMPTGWMPNFSGSADSFLTICTSDVSVQKAGDSSPRHAPDQSDSQHHDFCPFAAAPHLASTPDVPQLAEPSVHTRAAAIDRSYARALFAYFTPGAPRAPPLNV